MQKDRNAQCEAQIKLVQSTGCAGSPLSEQSGGTALFLNHPSLIQTLRLCLKVGLIVPDGDSHALHLQTETYSGWIVSTERSRRAPDRVR